MSPASAPLLGPPTARDLLVGAHRSGALPLAAVSAYTAGVDSGVPQTSKRDGSRAGGGGVGKTDDPKGATARSNGNGSVRPGPVDPRTEDPSSAVAKPRAGKTLWRRPGSLIPRASKHRESGDVDAPVDFSVDLPFSLAPADPLVPAPVDTVGDVLMDDVLFEDLLKADTVRGDTVIDDTVIGVEPVGLAPTVEVWTTTEAPEALAPTEVVPTDLRTLPMPLPMPMPAPTPPILYDEAATIDDVTQIGPVLETRPLRKPVHFRRAPRPRVRRVTRVVRHVDTWSVFKVALVFSVFFYAVALIAGVLLWQVAYATGTIDNVEKFFEGFGWETFKFNGGQIFHNAWIAGLFVAVGLTGLAVLLATLFNLITDLVGGVRFSVLEEEVRARTERGTAHVHEPKPVADDSPPTDAITEAAESAESAEFTEFDESLAAPPDEAIVG